MQKEELEFIDVAEEPKKTEKNTMNLEIKLMANEIAFIRVQKIS